MPDRFQLFTFDEALEKCLISDDSRYYNEYSSYVVEVLENGYRLLGSDGGEPEDQVLYRDWKWVVPELNKAFLDCMECKNA